MSRIAFILALTAFGCENFSSTCLEDGSCEPGSNAAGEGGTAGADGNAAGAAGDSNVGGGAGGAGTGGSAAGSGGDGGDGGDGGSAGVAGAAGVAGSGGAAGSAGDGTGGSAGDGGSAGVGGAGGTGGPAGSGGGGGSAGEGGAGGSGGSVSAQPGISFIDAHLIRVNESGTVATFGVVLDTQPESDVTLEFESSDASEGSVSPTTLLFTRDNWETRQNVNVAGVDDDLIDDDVRFEITTTVIGGSAEYTALAPAPLNATNVDDDVADIISSVTGTVETHELAISASFTLALTARPTADVTLTLSSSDATEGVPEPNTLVFPKAQWNVPQTVTVTGKPEAGLDGGVTYEIRGSFESGDTDFANALVSPVSVFNADFELRRVSPAGQFAYWFDVTPGGEYVVYVPATEPLRYWVYSADSDATVQRAGSVDMIGPGNVALDGTLIFGANADSLVTDTNSTHNLFAEAPNGSVDSLFSSSVVGDPWFSDITPDGNWVAFYSDSDGFIQGDTNAKNDVFLIDRTTGVTERVSVTSSAQEIPEGGNSPSISADGCRVAFASKGLVMSEVPRGNRVYVHDRCARKTFHVTHSYDTLYESFSAVISSDGSHVAFESTHSSTDGVGQVLVANLETGSASTVSRLSGPGGAVGDDSSWSASISKDGRFVAFTTQAGNLRGVSGLRGAGTSVNWDVCVRDRQLGHTRCVPTDVGTSGDGENDEPRISDDGNHLVFRSNIPETTPGGVEGMYTLYRMELGDAFWNSPLVHEPK